MMDKGPCSIASMEVMDAIRAEDIVQNKSPKLEMKMPKNLQTLTLKRKGWSSYSSFNKASLFPYESYVLKSFVLFSYSFKVSKHVINII